MAKIAVTGAAGNVGRTILDAFDGHAVTPLVHNETDDIDGVVHDVTDREGFVDVLAGHDVLIHLAGNPSPYADWDDLSGPNVAGTYNAYEAALDEDLDRVVFASSNHAVNMEGVTTPDAPETMAANAPPVHPDAAPRPDTHYGVTKVAGEALGNYYADRHGLDVVNARIGWLMTREELAATQDDPEAVPDDDAARFARAMWLSPRDCRDALRRAATAELPTSPLTVHAVSRNDDRSLSLTHTQRTLGYRPRDNAAEALDR